MSAEFFVGMLIGVGFGILIGLACTLTYAMKQFRRLDQVWATSETRRTPHTTGLVSTEEAIVYPSDLGTMGNED